jgi:cobalt-zinc-cadmium efflux system outer membrane protein
VLQAELEVESASILYQNALNAQLKIWREVAALVGQATMTPQPLDGRLEEVPQGLIFEESLSQIQSQSPEIVAVLAKIDRARCNVQRQLIEIRPNVTVSGLYNWRDNGIGGDPDGAFVITMPIPVWNRNQGAVSAARYELAAAQRELQQVELGLGQRLAPVFEQYSNAAEQVERFRNRILPKAIETLKLTRQSYELGEISFVNLLTVQRTYANNQLAYVDAMESLRLAEIEIGGLLLSGSLVP